MVANQGITEGRVATESSLRKIEERTVGAPGKSVRSNDTSVTVDNLIGRLSYQRDAK